MVAYGDRLRANALSGCLVNYRLGGLLFFISKQDESLDIHVSFIQFRILLRIRLSEVRIMGNVL